jgi:hypothetical protein
MSQEDTLPRPNAERQDANPRVIAALAGSLLLLVGLGLFGGRIALGHSHPETGASARATDELFQHGVQAKTDIDRSWEEIAAAAQNIGTYAWADRGKGIVQVPIDRAIDLVCEQQGSRENKPDARHSLP